MKTTYRLQPLLRIGVTCYQLKTKCLRLWKRKSERPKTDTVTCHGHLYIIKEQPLLSNNHSIAITCLEHLKWKFLKYSKYKEDYIKFMNEVFNTGDEEEAPALAQDDEVKWYIPHHGVYHAKKNNIRVVFDWSGRSKGISLNAHLQSRPDLTNLMGVLCRFRRYPYAVTRDVEKMFHQFVVSKTGHDVFGGLMVTLSSKSPRSTEWNCIRLGLFKKKRRTLQQQGALLMISM